MELRSRHHRLAKTLMLAVTAAVPNVVAGTISYTGGIVQVTIPTTGIYDITAAGAQGGSGTGSSGGLGAVIEGDVLLNAGTVLDVVVGGQGNTGAFGAEYAGGGGGGTFIYIDSTLQLLFAAGGGGGAGYCCSTNGMSGEITTSGDPGQGPGGGAGGTNGLGGGGGTGDGGNYNGGGGGGWLGNGGNGLGSAPRTVCCGAGNGGSGAFSFAGGLGGSDDPINGPFADGGFGGGGGGGYQGGGGGGGYSGGGGGDGSTYAGGGGGSYLALSVSPLVLNAGTNSGNGFVNISNSATPEPGTIGLFVMGLAGLALMRRKKAQ